MSVASACNNVIKLRGLPWNVTNQDIIEFLKDIEIKGAEYGVHLITSPKVRFRLFLCEKVTKN